MLKVLIIEDELIVARNLENLLTDNGYEVIGVADRYEKGMLLAEKTVPDLILCDIKIKGEKTGIDFIVELRKTHVFKLIYLTAYSDEEFLNEAACTNPDSFIIKPYTERQLLASIRLLYGSDPVLTREQREKLERYQNLSEREKDIIKKLAEGKNSKQIATELFISSHTVDTHRRHILLKMDFSNSIELVVYVIANKLL